MKRAAVLLMSLLLVLAGGIGYWIGRSNSQRALPNEELVGLKEENERLKRAMKSLAGENVALPQEAGKTGAPLGNSGARGPRQTTSGLPADAEMIRNLEQSLAAAHEASSAAQVRVKELESELNVVREERTRLAATNAEQEAQASSARRDAESKETELTRQSEQLAQLESTTKKLREESSVAGQKLARQTQVLSQLQELYRRRESYLTTMISRYREITEQYRAFASVLENRRGPEGTPGAGMSIAGPELGRIQTSIGLAEEELRQLTSLNAQVAKLQKELSAK